MQINSINNITFGQLKTRKELYSNKKILNDFETKDSRINIEKSEHCSHNIFLRAKNAPHFLCAKAQILIDKPEVYIHNMRTEERNRHQGLGTQMHLVSLIEMMENTDCTKIGLFSATNAIPFHIKFGFKPVAIWNRNLQDCLLRISEENTPELKLFAKRAKQLMTVQNLTPEAYAKYGNQLVYNFTKLACQYKNKKEMENYFGYTLDMELTKDDVIKNKDFYNRLFKKYGFDYQIT